MSAADKGTSFPTSPQPGKALPGRQFLKLPKLKPFVPPHDPDLTRRSQHVPPHARALLGLSVQTLYSCAPSRRARLILFLLHFKITLLSIPHPRPQTPRLL